MRTNHADWLQKLGKAKEEIPPPKAPPPNGRAAPVDDVKATEEKVDAPYPVCPFGELDTLWSKLESRNKLVVGRRPEVKVLPPPGRAPKAVYKPTSRNLKPAAEERKAKNGGAEYDFDDFDDVFANVDPDAVVSSTLKEPRQPKTAAHGGKKSGSQSLGNSSLSHKQSPWVDEGDSFFEGVDVDALESDALRRSAAFSDQNRSPLAPTFQGECAWRGGNGSNAGCGLPLASRPDNFPHQQPSGGQPQRGRAYEQQMSSSHAESSEPQPRGVSKSGAGDLRSAIKLKVLRLGQVQQKYRDYIISSDPVPAKIHQLKDEQASLQCEIDTMTEMMLQQSADHATGSVGRYSSDGRRDPSSFASNPGACSNMYAASGGAAYTAGDGRGSRHDAPGSSFYSGGGSNFYGGSDSYDRPGADAGAYSSAASAGTGGEHSRMGSINSHELSRNSVRNYEASRHSSLSQQDKMPFSNPRYTGDLPVTMQVVRQRLFNTFGHRKFRDGQEEIVKAALGGKDVFVLIPTGGGKSLCYQLPAVCSMGLTVVFSPLIALVQDQVQALEQDGVNAAYISSEMDYESEIRPIMNDMFRLQANDGNGLKMLYITPEKLSSSEQMKTALKRLYDRNLLSRFIVDEAHCMSQWGHDFRPDYLKLGTLRKFFPDVPIMALTATANKRVMDDAINRLGMKNPFRVVKSFNRGNLYYEVRPKRPSKIVDEIAEIACRYRDDSGIIYCLSRRDCEVLAEKLGQHDDMVANHIKVDFYHADRSPHEKKKAHKDWSCGRTKVICATVAFGMGINKPDCRYVIHHSFPKSITNYYQESGRAGRDGADSLCLVFFSFADKNRLRNMLTKDKSGREQHTKLELENLYRSVSFCDNSVECRRVLLLEYFGQSFDRKECNGTCDNCAALASGMIEAKERDCSQEVRSILNLTRYLCGNGKTFTVCQLAAFWRGDAKVSPGVNRVAQKCEAYGGGSSFSKSEAERIVQQMVLRFVLDEENVVVGREGFTASYVREGVRARDFDASTPPEFLVTYTTKKKAAQKPKPPVVEDAERRKAKDKGKGRSSKPQVHDITGGDASSSKSPGHSLPHSGRKRARDSLASEENNVGTDCSKHFSSKTVDEEQDEELEGCTYQDRIDRKLQVKLKEKMVDLRKTIGDEQRTNYYNYCSNAVIKNISRLVPLSIRDLRICGMGAYKVTVHGQRFLDVTRAFVEQHSLLLSPILNDPIPSASVENLPQTMVENELQICAMDEEPEGYWMSNVYDTQDFSTSQSP